MQPPAKNTSRCDAPRFRTLESQEYRTDESAHITLRAATANARRADTIAFHDEMAEWLKLVRPSDRHPSDRVFASIPKSTSFKNDVKRPSVAVSTDGRDKLDFHALRTTFGAYLCPSDLRDTDSLHLETRIWSKGAPYLTHKIPTWRTGYVMYAPVRPRFFARMGRWKHCEFLHPKVVRAVIKRKSHRTAFEE